AVHAPESHCMVWRVVEGPRLVLGWPQGETVNVPHTEAALYLDAVEAQSHVRTLAHIDEAPRAVFHLVSADPDFDPRSIVAGPDFQEGCLKIQLRLIDRSRATGSAGIQ